MNKIYPTFYRNNLCEEIGVKTFKGKSVLELTHVGKMSSPNTTCNRHILGDMSQNNVLHK